MDDKPALYVAVLAEVGRMIARFDARSVLLQKGRVQARVQAGAVPANPVARTTTKDPMSLWVCHTATLIGIFPSASSQGAMYRSFCLTW